MLHWNLLVGPVPIALLVVAFAGGVYLLARRDLRRWWTVVVPAVAVGSVGAAFAIDWFVTDVWRPFPDPLPGLVVLWIGVMLAALGLLVATLVRAGWRRRAVAVVATLAIVAAGLNQINRAYGYYPTLAIAAGQAAERQIPLPPLKSDHRAGSTSDRTAGTGAGPSSGTGDAGPTVSGDPDIDLHHSGAPLHRSGLGGWRPRGPLPRSGAVSKVTIPGRVSGFRARPAWVYLPPAYLVSPRPDLPVLMLIPGQPGSPGNWINAGHVAETMDGFAARHHGIAPIVVMPDATGSTTANTMCVNSRLGNSDTYLSRDVVNWVLAHLQVDRDTAHWAVGGFSFGGTCALQLAVSHPRLFPTFLDISGQVVPTLGGADRTVRDAFGGDAAAYTRVQPLHILAAGRLDPRLTMVWRTVTGIFAVGAQDRPHMTDRRTVMRACQRAGMAVDSITVPGTHSWYVAAAAVPAAMPRLADRMALL